MKDTVKNSRTKITFSIIIDAIKMTKISEDKEYTSKIKSSAIFVAFILVIGLRCKQQ